MELIICDSSEAASSKLAEIIEGQVRENPRLKMGLATGRSSSRAYRELVNRFHEHVNLTFRYTTCFNTDEYVGIKPEDSRSTRFFMNYHFYKQLDVALENTFAPRGDVEDIESECRAYDLLIKARGGLDLVVLGLGYNGHVGFNEPGSSVKSRTREVEFTESTLAALSDGFRFKNLKDTPVSALAMGLATIKESRHIIIIAPGIGKADAVHRMVDYKPNPSVPASQLIDHDQLTLIIDKGAASRLQDTDD
jgi:glucosamine-6-phosphate deaminase